MFVRFQFASTTFAEMVRDQLARSDVGCIPPTGSGFVVDRIEFPPAGPFPMDVDRSGDLVVAADLISRDAAPAPGGDVAPVAVADVPEGAIAFRLPGHLADTIFGQGYETIHVPVDNGPDIDVRRQRLLLTLPTFLSIRTLDDMIAGSPGRPLQEITIALQLRVDLAHGADGKDRLRVAYHGVGHIDGNNRAVEDLIRTELAGTDTSREVEFDYAASVLTALAAMSGGGDPPAVVWSGMTLSPDRNTVELRLEVDLDGGNGSSEPDEWRRFLTRQIDVFRGAHDWAVELTRDLVDAAATAGARAQIEEVSSDFRLAGTGPHVEWRADFPGLRTTFTGEVIDACTCVFVDIDVNVSMEVKTFLRLVQGGSAPIVEVESVMSHDATHAGEQACCFVTGVALAPILGWKYFAEGKVGWGGMLLSWFVPVLGGVLTMALLFDASPELEVAPECRKEGDRQICTYPISLGSGAPGPCGQTSATITIDELRGRNNGLVMAGSVQQTVHPPPTFTTSTPTPFDWQGPKHSCSGPIGEWTAVSEFDITQSGEGYPLVIGEIAGVSWTGALYRPEIVAGTECPTTAHVRVGTLPFEAGNPFNGSILVLTNVGARMVTVPSVPPLSPAEKRAHERLLARWQLRFCGVLDLDVLGGGRRMAVRWLVDEAGGATTEPGDERVWVIRAFGLEPQSVLRVHDGDGDPDGDPLAEADGGGGRATRIDLLHTGREVHLSVADLDGRRKKPGDGVQVSIAQLVLREVGRRGLAAPATGLRISGPPSSLVLEAELVDGAQAIGLDGRGRLATGRRTALSRPVRPVVAGAPADGQRRPREAVRYRDRPWTDGLAFAGGGLWARLDDDGRTVRTYRVVDSLLL